MDLKIKKSKIKRILKYFTLFNFILKFIGLSPFIIKEKTSGPKQCFSFWGAFLSILHITTYMYCFFCVIQSDYIDLSINSDVKKPQVTPFDYLLGMYSTSVTVLILFLNILITLKAQRKMLTLFYRADKLSEDFVCKNLNKVKLMCIAYILNFVIGIIGILFTLFKMLHKNTIIDTFNHIIIIILPHTYVFSIVLYFVFCALFVQLGFQDLCDIMGEMSGQITSSEVEISKREPRAGHR